MKSSPSLIPLLFTGCAILALAACGGSGGGTVQQADLDAANDRAAQLESTLAALQSSLAEAQGALSPGSTAEKRVQAQAALKNAMTDLGRVQTALAAQPDSAAKAATAEALTAIDEALEAADGALMAGGALSGGSVGPLVLASMHTALDRAQTAIDNAQDKLNSALEAAPESATALRNLLSQAQATLTTTQVSLVPVLRQELADRAEEARAAAAERDAARADEKKAEEARDAAAAERVTAEAERDAARADEKKAEEARDAAAAERDAALAAQQAANNARDAAEARFRALDPTVSLGDRLVPLAAGGGPTSPSARANSDSAVGYSSVSRTDWTADVAPTGDELTNPANFAYQNKSYIPDEGVLYSEGNRLIGGDHGESGSGRLMLRGFVLGDGLKANTAQKPVAGNAAKGLPIYGYGADTAPASSWYYWRFPLKSNISFSPDWAAADIRFALGGPGVTGSDFERRARSKGGYCPAGQTVTHCDDATTNDVSISFGSPVQDPAGDAAYYWQTYFPLFEAGSSLFSEYTIFTVITFDAGSDTGNCAVTGAAPSDGLCDGTADREGILDTNGDGAADTEVIETTSGTYVQRPLYNTPRLTCSLPWCAGIDPRDAGLGPFISGPRAVGQYRVWLSNYAGENSYLDYAAYGLFQFIDYVRVAGPVIARSHAFHFGYDAWGSGFAAVPGTGDTLEATFKGHTTGWLINARSNPGSASDLFTESERLRGTVELTAMIGGTASGNNTITGSIKGIEVTREGLWTNSLDSQSGNPLRMPDVTLGSGVIAADGTYTGATTTATPAGVDASHVAAFEDGAFEGAFYGPKTLGDLETAGSWYLPPAVSGTAGAALASFGAKSVAP